MVLLDEGPYMQHARLLQIIAGKTVKNKHRVDSLRCQQENLADEVFENSRLFHPVVDVFENYYLLSKEQSDKLLFKIRLELFGRKNLL